MLPLIWSCSGYFQEIPIEAVTISPPSAEMGIGETLTLTVTVSPSNATGGKIIWASSKTSVATVDQNGNVLAVAEGSSTITATIGRKVGSCVVTVIDKEHLYTIAKVWQLEDGAEIQTDPLLVVAKATIGFIVSDKSGNLYVHGQSVTEKVNVGDSVQFIASKSTYRNLPELMNVSELNILSTGNMVSYPEPIEILDAEELDLSHAPLNNYTYCKAKGDYITFKAKAGGIVYDIKPHGSLGINYIYHLFYPYDYQSDSDFYNTVINLETPTVEFEGYFIGYNAKVREITFVPTSISIPEANP